MKCLQLLKNSNAVMVSLFFVVAGDLGMSAEATGTSARRKPNVLYVIADMQRAYSMGCYGDANARTPALDSFAREGLRLDACISTTPVCCPHRASLMSGQFAHHNGMMSNGCKFKPTVKCLGESFRDDGYETGYVGKWHLGRAEKDTDPTYGFPGPKSEYGVYHFARDPAPTTDIALKFIAEKSKGTAPWMLFVSWIFPHAPYKAPDSNRKDFGKVSIPPNVPAGAPHDFAEKSLPDYYGMIEAVDQQFARLMEALKQAGVADDTIVIFSSDHGDMIGSQGYKAKRWPYEESARVPFLIRYPRVIPAGRVLADPFGTPDIYPTLAGLAHVPQPKGLDGMDFSKLFSGKTDTAPRDYVYLEMAYAYVPWPGWRAFRTRDAMYARTVDKPWLLYDLKQDRWETNNLAGKDSNQSQVKQMDERLAGLMKQYGDSWTMKTSTGDVDLWLPGGPKQHSQNLGVPYPGELKSSQAAGPKGRAAKRAAKAKAAGDDDD
jgi:arylsulfatase A-like enzyme